MSTISIMIALAIFGCVAAAVMAVATLAMRPPGSAAEDRLENLARSAAGAPSSDEPELLSQPLTDQVDWAEQFFSRFLNVRVFLEQAESPITAMHLAYISGGLCLVGCVIPLLTGLPVYSGPLLGLALAFLPMAVLAFKRKRRLSAFGKQLPEALDLIARALRSGHSLAAGINLAATEMADPLGKEFGRCYEEQNLGIPLEDALDEMTTRVPNLDLRFFATAVILQRQTGGDLAEILDKIGHLVRERFKIFGQIQALTGEGRLSGVVLLALPPVLFGVMYRLNPKYMMPLFTDPMGQQLLAFAVAMQIFGALVIRHIIRIKV